MTEASVALMNLTRCLTMQGACYTRLVILVLILIYEGSHISFTLYISIIVESIFCSIECCKDGNIDA